MKNNRTQLPKLPDRLRDDYRMPNFLVGDLVFDELTTEVVPVIKQLSHPYTSETAGYVVASDYLDGYRHAWEVSLPFGVWDEEQ
jgi:hypothetical protein